MTASSSSRLRRCGRRGQLRDAGRVTREVRRHEIDEVAHRGQSALDRLPLEQQRRMRFAAERLLPHGGVRVEAEDVRGVAGEAGGHLRIERMPRALARKPHDAVVAPDHALERGVHREMHDPHRQRDRLALRPAERAVAVPAVGEVGEQAAHGGREPQALGEHARHLARGGEVRTLFPRHPRHPAGELQRARRRRAPGVGERAHEPGEDLAPGATEDGVEMGGERTAEDLRGDVRLRGAAGVEEQARVVGLRGLVVADPEALREPHRDQRAVQAVLERESHPEVRREAERRHQLRAADLRAARRRCG